MLLTPALGTASGKAVSFFQPAFGTVSISNVAANDTLAYVGGAWVNQAAVASGEIDYVENTTGTPTACSASTGAAGTAVDITSLSKSVTTQTGPVWIKAKVSVQQTAAGTGRFVISIVETTSGSTLLMARSVPLPNTADTRGNGFDAEVAIRLASIASTRSFKVQGQLVSLSGAITANVLNLGVANSRLAISRNA